LRALRPFLETTSIVKQLFFVHTQIEFVCKRNSRHVQRRHGPRGGEMLPPLPLAAQTETREGWLLQKRVVHDPVLTVSARVLRTGCAGRRIAAAAAPPVLPPTSLVPHSLRAPPACPPAFPPERLPLRRRA